MKILFGICLAFILVAIVCSLSSCASLKKCWPKDDMFNMGPLPAEQKPAKELTEKELRELKSKRPRYFMPAIGEQIKPSSDRLDEMLPDAIIALWKHDESPPIIHLAFQPRLTRLFLL